MLSVACGIKPSLSADELKIVGGTVVMSNCWPWQVSLNNDGEHFCGGILLDQNWVLTAALCKKPSAKVVLGEHNLNNLESNEQVCDNL